jgi:hypothetical protein
MMRTKFVEVSYVVGWCLAVVASATAAPLALEVEDFGPLPVMTHVATPLEQASDGAILLFGGSRSYSDPIDAHRDIWRLDLATRSWSREPLQLPYEYSNACCGVAVQSAGKFYLTPGFATGDGGGWGSHRRVIEVDPIAGISRETAAFPFGAVWGIGGIEARGRLYYFGGWNGGPQTLIVEYDPVTGVLVQVADMAVATNEVVATLGVDGWIYYWGRLHGGQPIERFDPLTKTVQVMSARLPAPVEAHPAYLRWHVPAEGAIYLAEPSLDPAAAPRIVHRFDYLHDVMGDSGARAAVPLVNQRGTRDEFDPYAIFSLAPGVHLGQPFSLVRLRLTSGGVAPTIQQVTASPATLWPPNHKMVKVTVDASVSGGSAPVSCRIVGVTSNEPQTGQGNGDAAPDWQVLSDLTVNLRAERAGGGGGRRYEIAVDCSDSAGRHVSGEATVSVPHDRR